MLNTSKIKDEVSNGFNTLLRQNNEIRVLYKQLKEYGDLFIVGGAIRDFAIQVMPRDLDIIINYDQDNLDAVLHSYTYRRNRFGGYKLKINGMDMDIWSISNHWAFKEKIYECTFENIAKGAFYNLDALALNLSTLDIDADSFIKTLESKTLDLNLNEEYVNFNPSPEKNIMRALRLKKTWGLELSKRVTSYCSNWVEKMDLSLEEITEIEYNHYGDNRLDKIDFDLVFGE